MLLLPLCDLIQPLGVILAERFFVEFGKNFFDVGDHAEVGTFVLIDFGDVDIHMNDVGVLRKCRDGPRHTVVETRTEGDQQITLIRGIIRIVGAMHPEPAEGKRILLRK